jgi:hypothetical protein
MSDVDPKILITSVNIDALIEEIELLEKGGRGIDAIPL